MKISIWYPVKPLHVNQNFGDNAAYYAKFLDKFGNPEKGHMGIDLMATHGQPVYAPVSGTAFYAEDDHGGQGVYIKTDNAFDYAGGTSWFNLIHWHLIGNTDPNFLPPIPMGGVKTHVKIGDLIGYANNTGAPFESSGDHLHLGLMPCDVNGNAVAPANGYGGCIDPAPYFNSYFAQDSQTVFGIIGKMISLLQSL